MTNDRRKELENILEAYQEQIHALEMAIVTASDEDKVRLKQKLSSLRQDSSPYEDEYRRLENLPPLLSQTESPKFISLPTGAMPLDSPYYVERQSDRIALDVIEGQGVTLSITGSREVGRTSLLYRVIAKAKRLEKKVALINFHPFAAENQPEPDIFYRWFCTQLAEALDLEHRIDEHWQRYKKAGNSSCCTYYLKRYLLEKIKNPLVIALDEVEQLIDTSFQSEFFGMLRSWHGERAFEPGMKNVDLVLSSSVEPYRLIKNINQSPFNVGEIVKLQDFSEREVAVLNQKYGFPIKDFELKKLQDLLNGHPRLIQQTFYLITIKQQTVAELLETAATDQGAFRNHLRDLYLFIDDRLDLKKEMQKVVREQVSYVGKKLALKLEEKGLVRIKDGGTSVRCELYRKYFKKIWLIRG